MFQAERASALEEEADVGGHGLKLKEEGQEKLFWLSLKPFPLFCIALLNNLHMESLMHFPKYHKTRRTRKENWFLIALRGLGLENIPYIYASLGNGIMK